MNRLALTVCALLLTAPLAAQWTQFGGPARDFALAGALKIADWGEAGPLSVWRRELGPGYAGLVSDPEAKRLFTLTRDGEEELIVALDARTGGTIWEHRYSAPVADLRGVDMAYGNSPQATPALGGGRLFSLGFTGIFHALDIATGKVLWSKDLAKEHQARIPYFGHASSPLLIDDPENPQRKTIVVLAGGALAFDSATGALQWENRTFQASYASPILAETAFGPQIIAAGAGEIVALEPSTGALLWRHEYANQHRTILGTPILVEDDLLFVSVYFLGSRGLRLVARDRVQQIWEQPDFQVSQFNAVRRGSTIFSTFRNNLLALDARTGEILWRERRFGSANLVQVGSRTLLLGDSGQLTAARLHGSGIETLQSARILDGRSWTPPTVIGDRLYARDQGIVLAHDLSAAAPPVAASKVVASGEAPVPPAFSEAVEALNRAGLRSNVAVLEAAVARFTPWAEDPRLGTWAAYHRGFGFWQLSFLGTPDQRLRNLDLAVEEQKRAVDLDGKNAEAHAVLGSLYSSYYRLAPQRAAVIGPLGDEHLARALILEPDNPRVRIIRGLDLAYSPEAWGGDPAEARRVLAAIVTGYQEGEPSPASGAGPIWGPAMARALLARLLLTQDPKDAAEARRLLDEALALHPDFTFARSLRDGIPEPASPKAPPVS